jgi:hypothetical protein
MLEEVENRLPLEPALSGFQHSGIFDISTYIGYIHWPPWQILLQVSGASDFCHCISYLYPI